MNLVKYCLLRILLRNVGVWLNRGRFLANRFLFFSLIVSSGFAQTINIAPTIIGHTNFQVGFSGNSNFYYLLLQSASLANTAVPSAALLGTNSTQSFQMSIVATSSRFFRVEQLPLIATNDIIGDGIPDAFKLENGLPVFGPSQVSVVPSVPPGNTNTWLQIYQASTNLPSVSFILPNSQVEEGQGIVAAQLQFSKPFSGFIYYSYSGSAVAGLNGDYRLPSGAVSVNGSSAAINLTLLDDLVAKPARTIILTLNPDPSVPPKYSLGNIQSHDMVIEDNDGLWSGQLVIGPLTYNIQMNIAQQGTTYQAMVTGGNSYFPAGNWPVALTIGTNSFNAVVGPIQSVGNSSLLEASYTRYLYLTATSQILTNGVLNLLPTTGTATEQTIFSNNSYLNRSVQGTFNLQRLDVTAPSTMVPLIPVNP